MLQNRVFGLEEAWAGKDFLQVHARAFSLHTRWGVGFQKSRHYESTQTNFIDTKSARTTQGVAKDKGIEVTTAYRLRLGSAPRLAKTIAIDRNSVATMNNGNNGQCAHAGHYPGVGSQWTGSSVAFIDPVMKIYTSFMSRPEVFVSSMYIIASQCHTFGFHPLPLLSLTSKCLGCHHFKEEEDLC